MALDNYSIGDSPRSRILKRALRSPQMIVGSIFVGIFLISAIIAPILSPKNYAEMDLSNGFQPPSKGFLLGTDELGRDLLSRVLYGGQVSLQVASIAVSVGLLVGVPLGIISGYYSGWVESVIMRLMDTLQAFPPVLLAIVIVAILGPGLQNAMVAIGIVNIPQFARIMRSQALQIKNYEYITAARSMGASGHRIILRHILPNGLAPIIVAIAITTAGAILTEAALSFVGLGVMPPRPSWGGLLQTGYPYMQLSPWLSIFPGAAIAVTTLGFNFLGDGLRDVLDPRLARR